MAAPGQAAAGPEQAIQRGDAAPASLATQFAEATASAEGGIAAVLDVYGGARRRFSAAQRDALARAQLQRACIPAGPLLDTVTAHLDSANLDLCAIQTHPFSANACFMLPALPAQRIRASVLSILLTAHCSSVCSRWQARLRSMCRKPLSPWMKLRYTLAVGKCRNHGAAELSGWVLAEPAFVADCSGVPRSLCAH